MKYTLVALAMAAAARAQTAADIPSCALPCIDDAISSETSCDTTDFACACSQIDVIQGAATGCVLSECGADVALGEVLPAIESLCASVGDGETPAEPTEEPTEEPTAEPTAEPTEEPTEEPTAEPTEEPTAEPTEEPTEEPTPEPTVSETPTVLPPPPTPTEEPTTVPTGGAAAIGHIGAVAIAALGFLAL